MSNELVIFLSFRPHYKQRCIITVAPVSYQEVLTPNIELTEDFPFSYPVPLGEH
jgi:hypothetical protein